MNFCDSERVMEKISGTCLLHPAWPHCTPWKATTSVTATLTSLDGWRHYFNHRHQIVLFRCSLSPVAISELSRCIFSGAKEKTRFQKLSCCSMRQYFHTVNWDNWAIMSYLLFPHHTVLPQKRALVAQPTPGLKCHTRTLEPSIKKRCSQMPRMLAVGHIWLYMAICQVDIMVVLWSEQSCCSLPMLLVKSQPYMARTDMLERSSRSTSTNFWSDILPHLTLAKLRSQRFKFVVGHISRCSCFVARGDCPANWTPNSTNWYERSNQLGLH